MKKQYLLAASALLSVTMLSSCFDDSYDLDDVDYTVGTEADLTLPSSSTGEILLKNIMNLKEDGVIQVVADPTGKDSMFVVTQSGKANIKPISIGAIKITKPTLSPFQATIDLRSLIGPKAKARKLLDINVDGTNVNIPDQDFFYDIKDGDAQQDIKKAQATGISTDVVAIERVGFDQVCLTLNLNTVGFPEYIPNMHLNNLVLTMPSELNVVSCLFDGVEVDKENIQPGKIQLTKPEDGQRSTKGISMKLTIDGAETGENFYFDKDKHTAEIIGAFQLTGTFRISTKEMVEAKMVEIIENVLNTWSIEEKADFVSNPDLAKIDGLIPATINFSGEASFDKDIRITRVTGDFQHPVDNIEPIKLDDLPDFLNDPDVILDLDNPMIYLTISQGVPGTAYTSISLSNDINPQDFYRTGELSIAGGGKDNLFYLANKKETKYVKKGCDDAQFINVTNLGNLIRKIPKQINVDVAPVTLHCEDLDLEKTYPVKVDYEVYSPLAFGKDFQLVYQDTERGWAEDMDDVEDLNAELLIADAKVTSTVPAYLDLTLTPIDEEGKEIKQLSVSRVSIEPNAKNQAIRIEIKATGNNTINDALTGKNGVKKLDGITYKAVIDRSTTTDAIPATTNIKLTDIKISIKGKVTYDAN